MHGPTSHRHWPPEQKGAGLLVKSPGQAFPHMPQLATSVCVFVHAEPQNVWPAGQRQLPPEQLCPPMQTLPPAAAHPPQLEESVCVFVHVEPQRVSPPVQPHLPPLQLVPPLQRVPPAPAHPPQLAESLCVFTHDPAQSVVPLGHAHELALQIIPPLQALPHPPQLALSVCVFAHLPAHVVVPVPQTHCPPWHTPPAPIALAHCWSTFGSSSTIPLQSLSLPSHTSGETMHWQTLLL